MERVYLYHHDERKIEKHFFKIFKTVEAAGGLVKNSNGAYLFIFRNKRWDLLKGKLQKNEIINEAAIREVVEETELKISELENLYLQHIMCIKLIKSLS